MDERGAFPNGGMGVLMDGDCKDKVLKEKLFIWNKRVLSALLDFLPANVK